MTTHSVVRVPGAGTGSRAVSRIASLVLAIGALAGMLEAQQGTLGARVGAARNGTVEFTFPARDGVCGDGQSYVRVSEHTTVGTFHGDRDRRACVAGPVRVALSVRDGAVTSVRGFVGPLPAERNGVTNLGEVSAAEGSAYLLALAEREPSREVGNRAIFPALLGEGVVAWPTLLRIARQSAASGGKRRSEALFWLGRYAAAKANGSDDPFQSEGDSERDEVSDEKANAVFVMSQLGRREGIEPLIQVARTNRDPRVRSKAMFWLGESGDPRAIDLFEEVLTGRPPR